MRDCPQGTDGVPILVEIAGPPADGDGGAGDGARAEVALAVPDGVVRMAAERYPAAAAPLVAVLTGLVGLVHRYTGSRDVVVAHPTGDAVLPLRVRLPEDPTWRAVLDAAGASIVDAHANSDPSAAGLLDAAGAGIAISHRPSGDGHTGVIRCHTARYSRPDAERMARDLTALLEQCARHPDEHLSNLSLLDGPRWREVVHGWNDTTTAYPRDATVADLVERWARDTPDAPALRAGDRELTYRQLDERANRLAHHLRGLGIAAESRVGLCLRDTVDWVTGALATLKLGAAYVPLDPAYPADRLAYMCRVAQVRAVLFTGATRGRVDPICDLRVDLDALSSRLAALPASRPAGEVHPEALAYVMFTSGSTGQPKGVGVTHRGIVRLVRDTNYLDVRPADVVAQGANISFDASTLEAWAALLNGARLVGVDLDDLLVPHRLRRALQVHGVTVLFLTTALMRQTALDAPDTFAPVRYLIFGGEAADLGAVMRVRTHCPHVEVVNAYGPTENTVLATTYGCGGLAGDEAVVPIGRPVSNTTVYVLDRYLQPVPPGVTGELYAGGDGVARGYLGHPRLTAERFLPDPFATRPGARLYRTGDLVRQRPDGLIEFVGRADEQVKVRGFRVEPGEVEQCLRTWGPREVVVRVDRDPHGDARLVAYVVLDGAGDVDGLREHARRHLPAHMVPEAFVVLPRLPLKPNGKVDTAALPTPDPSRRPTAGVRGGGRMRPGTATERAVAEIWCDLLAVDEVDADDNFFDLGGRSLKATRVRSRLSAVLGVDLPLRMVFEHPTVAALAAAADRLAAETPHGPDAADGDAFDGLDGAEFRELASGISTQGSVADLLAFAEHAGRTER
jgi:amino acid adenylation domain-containing protein